MLAHPALSGQTSVVVEQGGLLFAPLVTHRLNLYAEVSLLLFRQQPRGTLITDGSDIDNRLKTLLDEVVAIISVHVRKTALSHENGAL